MNALIQQRQVKYHIQQELRTSYRALFESKFAIGLINGHQSFSSVKQVSDAIVALLTVHTRDALDVIANNPNILTELRAPFFGSIYDENQCVTASDVLEAFITTLQNTHASLAQVMQMHCIFIHRFYDALEVNPVKEFWVKKIFKNTLFSSRRDDRLTKSAAKPTAQLGFSTHAVFNKRLEQGLVKHVRAIDNYQLKHSATFFKEATQRTMPVVCGPSGHTGSLLLGAKLYGQLTAEQLQEYALASFAFLAAGGNHSFHEVMIVAQCAGVAYQENNYTPSIPDSIKETFFYQELCDEFPEYLGAAEVSLKQWR